jgi:hypothetical protein
VHPELMQTGPKKEEEEKEGENTFYKSVCDI